MQSPVYELDLNTLPPSVVQRLVCFLHTHSYESAPGQCTMRDHITMNHFGVTFKIESLQEYARMMLLNSWLQNDDRSVDFQDWIGSIEYIYEYLPPHHNETIRKVRQELLSALDFPISVVQLSDLRRCARMYDLFRTDFLGKFGVDLSRRVIMTY